MIYEDVIKKYGTPTYLFDTSVLIKRINYLKSYLMGAGLVYAVKANTFIVKELIDNVERLEICSPGEYRICKKLGIDPQKMVISGVYKDEKSIEQMLESGDILRYTIESLEQWHLLNKLASKHQKKIKVLIRLTSGNQFGISEEDLISIIKNNDSPLIEIMGLEYFSGTQKHSLKRIDKEITYLIELMDELESTCHFEVKELEYGPGLPVYYFEDDEFNEDAFLSEFANIIAKVKKQRLSLELGRSIAACCGSYLTSIVDMKTNKNGNFVLVDGGIHHLVYYGGTMAMRTPHLELFPKRSAEEGVYNIYGSLCTINDVLVKSLKISKPEIGDTFIFKIAGAYSVTEGISLFLSRDLPKVVIKDKDGNLKLVRDEMQTSEINFPNYEREEL